MKLSPNFSLDEFTKSPKADALKIDNTKPTPAQIAAMKELCDVVLEPLRAAIRLHVYPRARVILTSGWRCPALNKAVGGSRTSDHPQGRAADIHIENEFGNTIMTADELYRFILAEKFIFDQLLAEFGDWVHISFRRNYRMWARYVWLDSKKKVHYTSTKPTSGTALKTPAPLT